MGMANSILKVLLVTCVFMFLPMGFSSVEMSGVSMNNAAR